MISSTSLLRPLQILFAASRNRVNRLGQRPQMLRPEMGEFSGRVFNLDFHVIADDADLADGDDIACRGADGLAWLKVEAGGCG